MRFSFSRTVLTVSLALASALGCSDSGADLGLSDDTAAYPPGTVGIDSYGNPYNEQGQILDANGNPVLDPAGQPIAAGTPASGAATEPVSPVDPEPGTEPPLETKVVCTPACSDDPPPDQSPSCEDWASWGMCEPQNDWFKDYCNATCGRCEGAEEVCETVVVGGEGGTGGGSGEVIEPPPLPAGSAKGWGSRYWDCCKQHCSWEGKGASAAISCGMTDNQLSDANTASACEGGGAFTCWSMAPWAVSDSLSYGYAATPAGGNDCGKCYQLDFIGTGEHDASDPGSQSLAGKTMIVQSSNVGGDVHSGQFDLLIPGGGVGIFDGCSRQWGTSDLGARYGGFLTACSGSVSCLKNKCQEVFAGKQELLDGCLFHAEWMGGANNPQFYYKEVDCPAALEQRSGMIR